MHSGRFGCLTKLGAKRAEVVQKFMPLSNVGIFRNERTRSTPLDAKLTFWCVSYYLGAFRTIGLPYETWCKTGRTSAKVRAPKSCQNFSQRMHPIQPMDPKLTFWCVSYCLGAFGTGWLPYETRCKTGRTIWENSRLFGCLTKLGTKRAELVQKFVQRSRIRILATNAPDQRNWTLN